MMKPYNSETKHFFGIFDHNFFGVVLFLSHLLYSLIEEDQI